MDKSLKKKKIVKLKYNQFRGNQSEGMSKNNPKKQERNNMSQLNSCNHDGN